MAILVDPPVWPARGRLWAHLVSDTSFEELHAFAAHAGVPRRGFERDHYDVPAEIYSSLVAAGAKPVPAREVVRVLTDNGLRRRKSGAPARRGVGRELLRPPRLQAGQLVAVTATAGVVPEQRLAAGVARLESWGLRVRMGRHVLDRRTDLDYLAGTDEDRAADFAAAWTDPETAAIVAARGGYGSQRMLDLIDWRRLAEYPPKLVVGFSDVTALHQALASRLGLVSVHGHVVTSLGAAHPDGAEALRRLLMEPDDVLELLGPQEMEKVEMVVPGSSSGVLVGGNLMVLAAELGGPTSRPAAGGIVVLEEVNEPPYRIDRQLTQLLRSGWFEAVRGIVLGAFTNCGSQAVVSEVLRQRLSPLGVPVVAGADVGHTPSSRPVPLGVLATLDADRGSLRLARPALSS